MHGFVSVNQFGPKEFANALVAEANAQHWNAMMKMPDEFRQDAGPRRCFGAWRNDNACWLYCSDLMKLHFIVSNN